MVMMCRISGAICGVAADFKYVYGTHLNGSMMLMAEILGMLAAGLPVSEQRLATVMGISTDVVRQQVDALCKLGVPVQRLAASTYRLPWPVQRLNQGKIRQALPAEVWTQLGMLEVHWEVDSTSSVLLRRGAQLEDFSMLLAETQSAGRGRRDRPWLSPPGLNLYLSCARRFELGSVALDGLSLAVGVMVIRALHAQGITGVGLKWPNDVLAATTDPTQYGKLAGILVELSGQRQGACLAVIGIGLNLRLTPGMRAQVAQPITDLASLCKGTPSDRNQMAAALISALVVGLSQFAQASFAAFRDEYATYDLLAGKALRVSGETATYEGMGAGVDGRGALQLRIGNRIHCIHSTQVTVRSA